MSPTAARTAPQPAPEIADRLDRLIPRFDALCRDARLGHPLSVREYHRLEDEGDAIATELVSIFRSRRHARSRHAPLARTATGYVW